MWSNLFQTARKRSLTKSVRQLKRVSHFAKHKEAARVVIHERLAHYAPLCGVTYKRVAIRNQRRRWGSCSSLGNLNFNYRIMFLPAHLCDYVVVHELCHLKELNHGPQFWTEVAKVIPDYATCEAELRVIEKRHGAVVPQLAFPETSYFAFQLKEAGIAKGSTVFE